MTDAIEKIILSHLGKNARISSQDIATHPCALTINP